MAVSHDRVTELREVLREIRCADGTRIPSEEADEIFDSLIKRICEVRAEMGLDARGHE